MARQYLAEGVEGAFPFVPDARNIVVESLPNGKGRTRIPGRRAEGGEYPSAGELGCAGATVAGTRRQLGRASDKTRLCWTRHELVQATGLSYRTIVNLEARGLLERCVLGINVACYTERSVRALFRGKGAYPAASNST